MVVLVWDNQFFRFCHIDYSITELNKLIIGIPSKLMHDSSLDQEFYLGRSPLVEVDNNLLNQYQDDYVIQELQPATSILPKNSCTRINTALNVESNNYQKCASQNNICSSSYFNNNNA